MRLRIMDGCMLSTVAAISSFAGCMPVAASAATSLEAPNSRHQQAANSWLKRTSGKLVYVTNVATGTVTVFDRDGGTVGRIDGFSNPLGLFVDAGHNLWVANSSAAQILEFPRGATSPIKILRDKGGLPSDVTMCPNGTLYVSNSTASGALSGNILVYAPGSRRSTGKLTYPNEYRNFFLTCDAAGNIFSTLTINPGGGTVVEYPGGRQAGATQLPIKLSNFPGGIKQDHAGNILISDQIGHSVTEYTETGLPTGVSINSPDSYTVPIDIDVTDNGNVLGVALFDTNSDRADSEGQTYAFPTGTPLRSYGSFNKPIGFAFDSAVK